MKAETIPVGYIPLVDAAPLIVAQEIGFAAEEGLVLDLRPAPSWSALRDMLVHGHVDAAHLLSVVPVAAALGLGGARMPIEAVSVLSIGGNTIGVSAALAEQIWAGGHGFGFDDAANAGRALIGAAGARLRIGVPFPFSMHAELLYYWLGALGMHAPQALDIHTVPPPQMAQALRDGEIDAFCVGEPWGSMAVENGAGALLLPSRAIWSFAPEKVLAMRGGWAAQGGETAARLIRALWRAGRWLADPARHGLAAEILARPRWLNLPAEVVERSLTGFLTISGSGIQRQVPGFLEFHGGAAGFPWRSQARWIADRLAARNGLDRAEAMAAGADSFRADLYRAALAETEADLPGASSKLEGALEEPTAVASQTGTLILQPNRFFDGEIFDPQS